RREARGLAVENVRGEPEQLGRRRQVRYLAEIVPRMAHLIGIVQRGADQALVIRLKPRIPDASSYFFVAFPSITSVHFVPSGDISYEKLYAVGEMIFIVNRPFICMPPIFSSLVQVQVFPSTDPLESSNSPQLLNSRYVYALSSEEYPIIVIPVPSPIEFFKSICQTRKNPPSINSHFSFSVVLPPGPIGLGFMSPSSVHAPANMSSFLC